MVARLVRAAAVLALVAVVLGPAASAQQPVAPGGPTGLEAVSVAHDSVSLGWDDPGDGSVTGYKILRRDRDADAPGVFATIVEDTGSADVSYVDESVEPERRYVYRVVAVNAAGESPWSGYVNVDTPAAPVPAAPGRPTGLEAVSVAHDSVSLGWDDPGGGSVTGYKILRRDRDADAPGVFATIAEDTGSADASYVDESVEPQRRYVYRVVAVNAAGESPQSGYVNVDTPAEPAGPEPEEPEDSEPEGSGLDDSDAPGAADGVVWSGSLVVGEGGTVASRVIDGRVFIEAGAVLGHSYAFAGGSLSAGGFEVGGEPNMVWYLLLMASSSRLYLGVDAALGADAGLVLQVGEEALAVADAAVFETPPVPFVYVWDAPGVHWAAGDEVEVSLSVRGPGPAALGALSVTGAVLNEPVAPDTLDYTADADAATGQVTIAVTPRSPDATFSIHPDDADPDTDGHQIDLLEHQPSGDPTHTAVTIAIRSEYQGNIEMAAYTVTITRAEAVQSIGRHLESITLAGATLDQEFYGWTYRYTATADPGATQITVSAVSATPGQAVHYLPKDADPDTPGHQINLAEPGPNGEPRPTFVTIQTVGINPNLSIYYRIGIHRHTHPPATGFVDLDVGWSHACALRVGGQIVCWGTTDNNGRPHPARSPSTPGPFVDVTAGRNGSCGVRADGTALCFDVDQHGFGIPKESISDTGVAAISHYSGGTWLLRADGTVGGADEYSGTLPTGLASERFQYVHAGGYQSACGLTTANRALCWTGRDGGGFFETPTDEFKALSYGGMHACGIKMDDTLYCWDYLEGSFPGPGDLRITSRPSGTFAQVDTGYHQSCGVRSDGTAACWSNSGSTSHMVALALATPPDGTYIKVTFDYFFACGLKTDGSVVCWDPWRDRSNTDTTMGNPPPTVDDESRLALLMLTGTELDFDPDEAAYTADVANDVATVTVHATTFGAYATFEVSPGDGDALAGGHQVALTAGEGTDIAVAVTAQDGTSTRTYTVTVTRASS